MSSENPAAGPGCRALFMPVNKPAVTLEIPEPLGVAEIESLFSPPMCEEFVLVCVPVPVGDTFESYVIISHLVGEIWTLRQPYNRWASYLLKRALYGDVFYGPMSAIRMEDFMINTLFYTE